MYSFFLRSLVLLLVAFWVAACRGPFDEPPCTDPYNPDCINYDPCLGKDTAWAEFDILQRLETAGGIVKYFRVTDDTFFFLPRFFVDRVYFRARARHAQRYYWTIGADARTFTDSAFYLDFRRNLLPVSDRIDCRLVACVDSIDRTCFPTARLCDTVWHSFYYTFTWLEHPPYYPTAGDFTCIYTDAPNDTFCLKIRPEDGDIGTFPPPFFNICFELAIVEPVPAIIWSKKIELIEKGPYYARARGYGILMEHPRRIEFEVDVRPFLDTTDQNWTHHHMICFRRE